MFEPSASTSENKSFLRAVSVVVVVCCGCGCGCGCGSCGLIDQVDYQ